MSEKQELRTVEPGGLFELRFLQDGQLSPGGKTVAYVVSHVDTEAKESKEHAAIVIRLEPKEGKIC